MTRIQKTNIEEPLLRCAIDGTHHGLPHLPFIPPNHCWNTGKLGFGHVYLTFIVRNAFNLHRVPGFGERAFSRLSIGRQDIVENIFKKITEEDIKRSTEELIRIYEFTQSQLKNPEISGKKVKLYRGIDLGYSCLYKYVKNQMEKECIEDIIIETDTIDSYALGNGYVRDVTIVREVPVKDILFCDLTVTSLKEDEWLVINRHPKGFLKLEREQISIDNNSYNICIIERHINKHKKMFNEIYRKAAYNLNRKEPIYEETRLNLFDSSKIPEVKDTPLVRTSKYISGKICKTMSKIKSLLS